MNQPDFTRLFRETFGSRPKSLTYALREAPDLLHDVAFLTSLVHDARVRHQAIAAEDDRLGIPIERDCWELGLSSDNALHTVESKLIFSGVASGKWVGRPPVSPESWIDYLWVSEAICDSDASRFGLAMVGGGWRFAVTLDSSAWSCVLTDQNTPSR